MKSLPPSSYAILLAKVRILSANSQIYFQPGAGIVDTGEIFTTGVTESLRHIGEDVTAGVNNTGR
jgi:hypothetical protein